MVPKGLIDKYEQPIMRFKEFLVGRVRILCQLHLNKAGTKLVGGLPKYFVTGFITSKVFE